MTNRILARVLTVVGLTATAVLPSFAEDYQCGEPTCDAQISENGELKTVTFRRGDLVSTENGWIADPDDGWRKIRAKNKGKNRN